MGEINQANTHFTHFSISELRMCVSAYIMSSFTINSTSHVYIMFIRFKSISQYRCITIRGVYSHYLYITQLNESLCPDSFNVKLTSLTTFIRRNQCKCARKCIGECNSCCLKVTNEPNEGEIPLASASTNLNRL